MKCFQFRSKLHELLQNSSCDVVILKTSLYDWRSIYYGKTLWNLYFLHFWVNKNTIGTQRGFLKKLSKCIIFYTNFTRIIQCAKLCLLIALATKADNLKTLVPNDTIGVNVVPAMNREVYGHYWWNHTL